MRSVVDLFVLALVCPIIALLRFLPRDVSRIIARGVVEVILFFIPRTRRAALRNLEIAFPELSVRERRRLAARARQVLADNLVGFAKIPDLTRGDSERRYAIRREVERAEAFRARNPGPSLILATAHFGGFEEMIQAVTLQWHPVAILVREFGLPRFDRYWNRRRQMFGCEVFSRRGGFREILERLERGQDVAMLVDQNVKRNHAVFVDFFGKKAATSRAAAVASLRTGSGIIFAAVLENAPGQGQLFYREIDSLHDDPRPFEEKVEIISREINRAIEDCIREKPEQWFWIHRRFKTRPAGEPEDIYE